MNDMTTEQHAMASIVDDVIARGDLSKLTPEQRVVHYHRVCHSLGLNPLTQPFVYMTLQGKLQLYARKDAADQLRKINAIDIKIVDRVVNDGLLTVHVRATDRSGRSDEDFGVVSLIGLKGEAAANAMMKGVTKAKRRVTLSISGLGFADESEMETMGGVEVPMGAIEATNEPTPIPQNEGPWCKPVQLVEPASNNTVGWREWAQSFISLVRAAHTLDEIEDWLKLNYDNLNTMSGAEPKMYQLLTVAIEGERVKRGAGKDNDAG
jgi:hypothetical protein